MIFNCPLSSNFPHIKLLLPCQMSSFLTHPSPFSCLHLRNPKITSPILEQFKLHKLFCLLPFKFFSFYIGSHNNYQSKPVIYLFIYIDLCLRHLFTSWSQSNFFKYPFSNILVHILSLKNFLPGRIHIHWVILDWNVSFSRGISQYCSRES